MVNIREQKERKAQPSRCCTVDAGSSGPASPYEWLLDAAAAPYNDYSPAIPLQGMKTILLDLNPTKSARGFVKGAGLPLDASRYQHNSTIAERCLQL